MPFDESTIEPGNAGITGWARDFATPIIEDVEGLSLSAFNTHVDDDGIHASGRVLGTVNTATGIESATGATNTIITALDVPVNVGTRPILFEFFAPWISISATGTNVTSDLRIDLLNRTGGANTILASYFCTSAVGLRAKTGTATVASGNQSVSVTHGLGTTPTGVWLTATSSPFTSAMGKVPWVTSIGSTTFTLNAAKDNSGSAANLDAGQDFRWVAWKLEDRTYINNRFSVYLPSLAAGSYIFGVRYTTGAATWNLYSSGGAGALLSINANQNLATTVYEH